MYFFVVPRGSFEKLFEGEVAVGVTQISCFVCFPNRLIFFCLVCLIFHSFSKGSKFVDEVVVVAVIFELGKYSV